MSFKAHKEFLSHPASKVVIDNSTTSEAREGNARLCKEYGFEHIIQDENTGICGGRQFAAQHFAASESDFLFIFLKMI